MAGCATVVSILALAFSYGTATHARDLGSELVGLAMLLLAPLIFVLSTDGIYALAGNVAAEQRWVAGLPFRLTHYFEALGSYRSSGDHGGHPEIVVHFAADTPLPPDDALREWMAAIDATMEVVPRQDEIRRLRFNGRSNENSHVVELVHDLAQPLSLLHARYPIMEVEVV